MSHRFDEIAIGRRSDFRARLENYLELTREHRETREMAATRLKVCMRTVQRYEAYLREQSAAA